jgi:replicative DNA helicase
MHITDFLDRLEKVRKNGRGWTARCPAHEDGRPSLAVTETDGKILVNCFAGCSADKIVSALGLDLSDLFEKPLDADAPIPERVIEKRRIEKAVERASVAPTYENSIEQNLLGHIILNNELIYEAESELDINDLTDSRCSKVFSAMIELSREGTDISPSFIVDKLPEESISWVSNLTYGLLPVSSLSSYITKIKENSARLQLIKIGEYLQDAIADKLPTAEVLSTTDLRLDRLREAVSGRGGFRSFADVAGDVAGKIESLRSGVNPAISSGLPTLDKATKGGGQGGELHIWAGLTGGGKSALMKQMAHNISFRGIPVGIVTAEMSDYEVFFRMLSPEAGVPAWLIQHGMKEEKLNALDENLIKVANLPIWIDDRTTNIFEIVARTKVLKKQHDIKVLFVDYLQLLGIQPESSFRQIMSRAQEMATCSRTLKKLAKELDIWIVALAQFNRKANEKDEQGMTTPQIHHLAESGKLEQDSDLVGIIDLDPYVMGQPVRNAVLRIGKYRNGPPLDLKYKFNGDYLIFLEPNEPTVPNRRDTRTGDMYAGKDF